MKFYSRFSVAPNVNSDKVYDRHDNVNRISYVDSTQLVRRFINEGRSLNAARAAALRSGMYFGINEEIDNNVDPIIPVYESDPAIMKPIIDNSKKVLESRIAAAEQKRSVSESKANSDSTEPVKDGNRNGDQ